MPGIEENRGSFDLRAARDVGLADIKPLFKAVFATVQISI